MTEEYDDDTVKQALAFLPDDDVADSEPDSTDVVLVVAGPLNVTELTVNRLDADPVDDEDSRMVFNTLGTCVPAEDAEHYVVIAAAMGVHLHRKDNR